MNLDRITLFYEKALSGLELKQRVITNNIANQNTPGFRTKDVQFEAVLGEALGDGDGLDSVSYSVTREGRTQVKANGNDVSVMNELMKMEKVKLLHEIFTKAAGGTYRTLVEAIKAR
jgi:flagellar basal-body rod protein FlgB